MSDIEVEPVEEADAGVDRAFDVDVRGAGVDAPEYVLYGGKGGVGKTTMAAATALASAGQGVTTLAVSTDPAHSLSDVYDTTIPAEPTRIREDRPLYAVEIDPERAASDAAVFAQEGGGPLSGLLGEELGDTLFGGSAPGADEAAAVQQLLELLDDDRFDRVVVDTAPTGHTLRLLELPEVMDTMVGRLLELRERMGSMFEGLAGMLGGADGPGAPDEEDLDDVRVLADRIERLRATLRDPALTDFRAVMVPERMSVAETERLLARLEEYEIPVETVVVNRVMEGLADVLDEVPEDIDLVGPNQRHCEFCGRRWSVQQDALAEAGELFRDHEVRRVPLFAEEVQGDRALRAVAACLS
jgi:arsenite-transporting ATPase